MQTTSAEPTVRTTLDRPAEKICLALCWALTHTPLRRLSLRANARGNRYASMENYLADRVSNIDAYRRLFSPFAPFQYSSTMSFGGCCAALVTARKAPMPSFSMSLRSSTSTWGGPPGIRKSPKK